MKDELLVVLLITVPKPLKELHVQDSILVRNPSRVQFHFLTSLRVQKLPLRVLGDLFTLMYKDSSLEVMILILLWRSSMAPSLSLTLFWSLSDSFLHQSKRRAAEWLLEILAFISYKSTMKIRSTRGKVRTDRSYS